MFNFDKDDREQLPETDQVLRGCSFMLAPKLEIF